MEDNSKGACLSRGHKKLVYDSESDKLRYRKQCCSQKGQQSGTKKTTVYHGIKSNLRSCLLGVPASPVWGDWDLQPGEEATYEKRLHEFGARDLRLELLNCARLDLIERFMLAHDYLRDNYSLDYGEPEFHLRHMDNLLLVAGIFSAKRTLAYLIECNGSRLVLRQCVTPHFQGGTILHCVLLKGCNHMLRSVMDGVNQQDRVQLINMSAVGVIFNGSFFCMGLPLFLCILTGSTERLLTLIEYGGDPSLTEEITGNGIAHCMILYGIEFPEKAKEMMHDVLNNDVVKKWYCKRINKGLDQFTDYDQMMVCRTLLLKENHVGYTPLTFAALHGVYPVLQLLLHCEGVYKLTFWQLGLGSFCLYDVKEMDSTVAWLAGGKRPSVLELLLYERAEDDIPVLAEEPLSDLMDKKWQTWRLLYLLLTISHIITTMVHTYVAVESTHINNNTYTCPHIAGNGHQYGFRVFVLMLPCIYLCDLSYGSISGIKQLVLGRLLWPRSGYYFIPWSIIMGFDIYKIHIFIYSTCTLLTIANCLPSQGLHRIAAAASMMSGWMIILIFTRSVERLSFFTVMVSRMIELDLTRYIVVATIYVAGFSAGLLVLLGSETPDELSSIPKMATTLISAVIGMEDLSIINDTVAKHVVIVYMFMNSVLALNLLIAAMGDTYSQVSASKHALWRKLRVRAVLVLDRLIAIPGIRRRFIGKNILYDKESDSWYMEVHNRGQNHTEYSDTPWDAFRKSL